MENLLEFLLKEEVLYSLVGAVILVLGFFVARLITSKEVSEISLEDFVVEKYQEEIKVKFDNYKTNLKVEKHSSVDYSTMTVVELREAAKEKGLTGYTSLKKVELIALLKGE